MGSRERGGNGRRGRRRRGKGDDSRKGRQRRSKVSRGRGRLKG